MGKADLHLHTSRSYGKPSIRALLDHVREQTDLDVIAITDHDTVGSAVEARRMAGEYPFDIVVGEEVTSIDGHVVGLFLQETVRPGLSIEATVREIHLQGGLAFVPHPFFKHGFFSNRAESLGVLGERLIDACIDGIEVVNAMPALSWANARALRFADAVGCLAQLANSDAHVPLAAGKSYTLFPGGTAEHLRQAIASGATHPASRHHPLWQMLTYSDLWLRAMGSGPPAGLRSGVRSIAEDDLLGRA